LTHAVVGEVELYVDGVSVIHATGLTFQTEEDVKIMGIQFETFFGGTSVAPLAIVYLRDARP
jgi:hypothetical protein